MKNIAMLGLLGAFTALTSSFAQTIWTDGAFDTNWTSTANWNTGIVPISSTNVQIGTQPTADLVTIDTGLPVTVASFAFNNTLNGTVEVAPAGFETLQVNGAITNNSAFTDTFSLAVTAGASAVWSGPLNFSSQLVLGTNTITASNLLAVSGLTLDVNSAATYGKFAGAGSLQLDSSLNFNFTAATGAGSWDIASMTPTGTLTGVSIAGTYSGALTEVTPGNWAATFNSLDWTYKASTGVLTAAVPEPATWALLAGSLTTVMIFRRRRPKF
ncbi:MAG: PEP-CTERM sorting domain-containing protein [Verrucomicrobia bacterium]|nr:PEP-CTERM sorting domain-containing protein [Verrucomicrobiota bacterium]